MLDALKVWLAHFTRLPVRLNEKPDTPDSVVVLFEYGGNPIRALDKAERDVQFLFRGKTAHDDAWRVYKAMHPASPSIEGGGKRYIARPKQSPFFLERDVLDRQTYVFNATIIAASD